MRFVVEPRVTQWLVTSSPFFEKFFVYAKLEGLDGAARYLHADGVWRTATLSESGTPTGYFDTFAQANAILASTTATAA